MSQVKTKVMFWKFQNPFIILFSDWLTQRLLKENSFPQISDEEHICSVYSITPLTTSYKVRLYTYWRFYFWGVKTNWSVAAEHWATGWARRKSLHVKWVTLLRDKLRTWRLFDLCIRSSVLFIFYLRQHLLVS